MLIEGHPLADPLNAYPPALLFDMNCRAVAHPVIVHRNAGSHNIDRPDAYYC